MPVVEPVVTEEKLRQLLDEQHESESLDYKAKLCLSDARHLVEFAKDVAAMQIDGGFIVIGADDNGNPTGQVTPEDAKLLDESRARPKLARFLPEPFEIRCAQHTINGNLIVLVYVGPKPMGLCIFKAAGNYPGGTAFRAGDVFARHGTSSEPWRQSDIEKIFARRIQREKESWRLELTAYLEETRFASNTQNLSRGPAATLTWQLDEKTFNSVVIEQLRSGDTIPLTLLLNQLPTEAKSLVTSNRVDDFLTLLDRLSCLAALFINLRKPTELKRAVDSLNKIYDIGFSSSGESRSDLSIKSSKLWLEVIRRVYALGALAVRRETWSEVRLLILQRPKGMVAGEFYNNWLRHALTMASRAGDLNETRDNDKVETPLLSLSQQTARQHGCLSEDVDDESLLDSIAQFDVLFNVVAMSLQSRSYGTDYYPNFSRFFTRRSDPAFRWVVEDAAVREALTIPEGDELARILGAVFDSAFHESVRYSGWDGVQDPIVRTFMDQHPKKE